MILDVKEDIDFVFLINPRNVSTLPIVAARFHDIIDEYNNIIPEEGWEDMVRLMDEQKKLVKAIDKMQALKDMYDEILNNPGGTVSDVLLDGSKQMESMLGAFRLKLSILDMAIGCLAD